MYLKVFVGCLKMLKTLYSKSYIVKKIEFLELKSFKFVNKEVYDFKKKT